MDSPSRITRRIVLHRRVKQRLLRHRMPLPEIWSCLRDLSLQIHLERRGLRIKKLKGMDRVVFEARVNRDIRLIFTLQPSTLSNEQASSSLTPSEILVVWDIDHHDEALQRAKRLDYHTLQRFDTLSLSTFAHPDSTEAEEALSLSTLPTFAFAPLSSLADLSEEPPFQAILRDSFSDQHLDQLSEIGHQETLRDNHEFFELPPFDPSEEVKTWLSRQTDGYLHLSPEQLAYIDHEGPLLLGGSVGSGKTTFLLTHLLRRARLQPSGRWLLLTYSPTLTDVCQSILSKMPRFSEVARSIEIVDYLTFLRSLARRARLPERELLSYDSCEGRFAAWFRRLAERWQTHLPPEVRPLADSFPRPPWSKEILWTEFWHTLQGGLDFQQKKPLTLEGYLESRSEIPKDERPAVFALHTEFFQELQGCDELSLSHDLFAWSQETSDDLPKYDGIWIDEAQDLCEIQWMLLLRCLRSPRGLVMAGDPYQALRPSGFYWSRLQARLQEQAGASKTKPLETPWLAFNLRNSRPICTFVSEIIDSLRLLWDLSSVPRYTVAAQNDGPPIALLSKDEIRLPSAIEWLYPSGVVIVWDDDARKDPLLSAFQDKKIPILTVAESKGLEFDRVLLWGIWASLSKPNSSGFSLSSPEARPLLRTMALSHLYVALTRARRGLCLCETKDLLSSWTTPSVSPLGDSQSAWWEAWAGAEIFPSVCALSMYRPLYADLTLPKTKEAKEPKDAADPQEPKDSKGSKEFQDGLRYFRDTAQSYEMAALLEKNQDWMDAARVYAAEDAWEDAARCYEACGEPLLAQSMWLHIRDAASQKEDWAELGRASEKLRHFAEAAPAFQKAKRPADAARCFEKDRKFLEAIPLYKEAGLLEKALVCAVRGGKPSEVAVIYESQGRFLEASRAYLEAKERPKAAACFEKAEAWKDAASLYHEEKKWKDAARCYEEAGIWAHAAFCLEEAGEKQEAALCYEKAKDTEKALAVYKEKGQVEDMARCFETLGRYEEAALCYKTIGKEEEAAVCFECAGKWEEAVALYEKLGRWENIVPIYEEQKKPKKAAEICLTKLSDPLRAGQLYLRDHQYRKAAEAFEAGGFWEEAARCYAKVHAYLEAARCQEANQMWKEAALSWCHLKKYAESGRCFELAGDLKKALNCYAGEKMWEKAARVYEKLGQPKDAAKKYIAAEKKAEAARCYEFAEEWKEAADLWKKLKRWDRAASCYAKGERLASAAEAYEEAGNLEEAARLYEGLLFWDKAGATYEILGRREDGLRCYEKAHRYDKIAALYSDGGDRSKAADALRASEPAKAAAIYEEIGRPEDAALAYAEAKEYTKAAFLYENLGRLADAALSYAHQEAYEKALPLYLRLEAWEDAAACYLKLKDFSQASLLYERLGRLEDAALCALQAEEMSRVASLLLRIGPEEGITASLLHDGEFQKAAFLFLSLGKKEDAAACYRQAGMWDEAASLYEELEAWESLAEVFEASGDLPKAAVFLEKLGKTEVAASLYQKAGQTAHAARLYSEIERFEEAALAFLASGEKEVAARWFQKAGRNDEAAKIYLLLGQKSLAADLFASSGQTSEAAKLYKEVGDLSKAASCLEASHAFSDAARLWVEASSWAEAARCYKAAKAWRLAANCYQWACSWFEAAQCYEADGSYDEASFLYKKAGRKA